MDIKLHKQATTTPKIRAEIQAAPSSITDSELARQYGVSPATIRRWRYRDGVHDRPHTRHNLLATHTSEQEEVLIAPRRLMTGSITGTVKAIPSSRVISSRGWSHW